MAQALRRRGRFMLLATVEDATQFDVVDTLQRSRRIDGLVIVLPLANSLSLSRLAPGRVPIVHIDLQYDLDVYGITVNNYRGAYLATEHLIRLGHRRVGLSPDGAIFPLASCDSMGTGRRCTITVSHSIQRWRHRVISALPAASRALSVCWRSIRDQRRSLHATI